MKPDASELEAQFLEQRRQFPGLYRLANDVLLFGVFNLVHGFYFAAQTGNWRSVLWAFLTLFWLFSLAFKLRNREKWAWWVTLGGAIFYGARHFSGAFSQILLLSGEASPTAQLVPDPIRALFHGAGLILALLILIDALHKPTRALFFAPRNDGSR